jgi:superfamily II DNA or RNA helicase
MALQIRIRNNLEIQGASPELRNYLQELLTLTNPVWIEAKAFGRYTANIPQYIRQFEFEDRRMIVPRGLLEHLVNDLNLVWELTDERAAPEAPWGEGNVLLRPDDQETAVQQLMSHDNGFLSAPAGSGKTVMGLEMCRRLGLRALWLVHQENLKKQSIEEAVEHIGLEVEDIGILHGKKWKIGECLTVGMIPTLQRRDLSGIVDEFGTVVVDEAHHVPSKTFLDVVSQFNPQYLFGLTATAYRRDKLDVVMFNAIGPKVAEIEHVDLFEEEHLMIPSIKVRHTGWDPDGESARPMEFNDYMEAMVTAPQRNQMIVQDVVKVSGEPGTISIVLVERTKHAEVLAELIKAEGIKCDFVVGSVDVESDTPVQWHGRKKPRKKKRPVPKKVRERIISEFKNGEIQVLVATYDLLMEGFNYRPLNRLFLASPIKWKGNVVQALGRIQRPEEGKTDAIAYDYVDERIGMFARQFESRLFRVYEKMGMKVRTP